MKKNRFFAGILTLFAMIILLSGVAMPRAGMGHKYRPPKRSTPRRTTRYTSTPSRSRYTSTPRYGSTPTSTRRYNDSNYSGSTTTRRGRSGCGCCIGGPIAMFIFIVIIAVVIVLVLKKKKGKDSDSSENDENGNPPRDDYIQPQVNLADLPPIDREKVEEQLKTLKEKDPNFSEKVFLDKSQTAYHKIQRAWSKNALGEARQFMSEAQFNRMKMQQEDLIDRGLTNKVEDLVIGKVETVEAGVEGEHDFIKVLINASMSDKTVDKTGKIVEGSNEIQNVLEYWTFVRKQGAKTNEDGGRTVAHNCHNCGAPLDEGESAKCPYCDTTITNASFDWVMDTITQPGADIGEA